MIDGERTDAPLTQSEQLEATGADRVARLPGLVDSLAHAPLDEKAAIARELNDLLVAMRAPGQEAAEAAVVLAALQARKLDGAVDSRGLSCRKEAVETLLATGFPHALQVAPEDLEFARSYVKPDASASMTEWQQITKSNRTFAAVVAALAGLGTIGWNVAELGDDHLAARALSCGAALAIAFAAASLARRTPDTQDQATPAAVMALGAVAQLVLLFFTGYASGVSLLGAIIALFVELAGQYVPDTRKY